MDEKLLTAAEVARRLQVTPETVRSWARDGIIPRIKITPVTVRYDFADVRDALKRRSGAAQKEVGRCGQ